MKYLFLLLSAGVFSMATLSSPTTFLSGKVTDDTGEALIGANVKVLKGAEIVRGAITDYNGEYRIPLDPGTYNVEVTYTGYQTARIEGVRVLADKINPLDFTLQSSAVLNEVQVTAYRVPLIEVDKTAGGNTILTSDHIRPLPSAGKPAPRREKAKDAPAPPAGEGRALASEKPKTREARKKMAAAVATPASMTRSDDVTIKGERAESADYLIDGIRVSETPKPEEVKEEIFTFDAETDETPPGATTTPSPRAGLLTAGEWNDLHNWSRHWVDLQRDGEIDPYQKQYRFYPKNRFSLLLQTEENLPVSDAAVQLLDPRGTVLWETRTDNNGHAELWSGLFDAATPEISNATLRALVDGKTHDLGRAKPFAEGLNVHQIRRECRHSQNLDIVWAVDATGSMGDELEYLKTELLDVIGRVKTANPGLAVRMGSVFYRDKGDDYLVRSSALSPDIPLTVDYIRKQSAGGGGDYPEAVHSALEEAIYRQPWQAEAVARICFLVLDASPHEEPEVLESLQKSIREAAKKGIRIVPVSASGIQKDTEFLMKFFGLATNGSYVFLTDHSGIGGKHLEPTTDEYKVEQLNDLLVRLITEYCAVPTCDGKSTIRFEDTQAQGQQNQGTVPEPIVYYPNPASTQFTVELPFAADKVTLYDAEGKAVRTFAQMAAGQHSVPVGDLPAGFYTLRVWKGTQVQSGKVMVLRA